MRCYKELWRLSNGIYNVIHVILPSSCPPSWCGDLCSLFSCSVVSAASLFEVWVHSLTSTQYVVLRWQAPITYFSHCMPLPVGCQQTACCLANWGGNSTAPMQGKRMALTHKPTHSHATRKPHPPSVSGSMFLASCVLRTYSRVMHCL